MKTRAQCETALNSAIDGINKIRGIAQENREQAIEDTKGYYEAIMSGLDK